MPTDGEPEPNQEPEPQQELAQDPPSLMETGVGVYLELPIH